MFADRNAQNFANLFQTNPKCFYDILNLEIRKRFKLNYAFETFDTNHPVAGFGVDTVENGPFRIWGSGRIAILIEYFDSPKNASLTDLARSTFHFSSRTRCSHKHEEDRLRMHYTTVGEAKLFTSCQYCGCGLS